MASKKISQLPSGSLVDLPLSGLTAVVHSGVTYQHNLGQLRQILVDSGSHSFTGSQSIQGDLVINGSVTAHEYIISSSVTNMVTQNVSGSSSFGNDLLDNHKFTGSLLVSGSVISSISNVKEFLFVSGFAVIGDPIHHTGSDPEALHVGTTDSYNIAHFKGDNDYYSQVYIKNLNSGSNASTDLVVVADNGTEGVHFVDLGINSSTYTGGLVGRENDAYLLNVGKDLYVGTVGGTEHPAKLHLFAENRWENPQVTIHTGSQITFNTSSFTEGYTYEFSGSIKSQNDLSVAGSLIIGGVSENVTSYSGNSGLIDFDYSNSTIHYIQNLSGSGTWNIFNVPTTEDKAITVTFVIEQGSIPYSGSLYSINEETVNVKWVDSVVPTGSANKTNVIGLTLFRINSSWNVLGSLSTFGE
jgi:hypothetical protein